MQEKKYCYLEHLVGMGYNIIKNSEPALSKEEIDAGHLRGCGNLHCSDCDKPVKHWDGQRYKKPVNHVMPRMPTVEEELYIIDADKLVPIAYDSVDVSEYLEPRSRTRAYSCRCTNITVSNYYELSEFGTPLDRWRTSLGRWRCQGHIASE